MPPVAAVGEGAGQFHHGVLTLAEDHRVGRELAQGGFRQHGGVGTAHHQLGAGSQGLHRPGGIQCPAVAGGQHVDPHQVEAALVGVAGHLVGLQAQDRRVQELHPAAGRAGRRPRRPAQGLGVAPEMLQALAVALFQAVGRVDDQAFMWTPGEGGVQVAAPEIPPPARRKGQTSASGKGHCPRASSTP